MMSKSKFQERKKTQVLLHSRDKDLQLTGKLKTNLI